MYLRKTVKTVHGKAYENYLLVESVATPNGPRQRTVCSLGNLAPRSADQWLALVRKVETALLGQADLFESTDPEVREIVEKARRRRGGRADENRAPSPPPADSSPQPGPVSHAKPTARSGKGDLVAVHTDRVTVEESREAGPVHVGLAFWNRLGMDGILAEAGLSKAAIGLTRAMTLNRLIAPASEHAMPDWIRRTALADLVGETFETLGPQSLYRQMDRLHPLRAKIEARLVARERDLFHLDTTVYFYDLTSTYFEGAALQNPKAQRGYSRDSRPDAKQVVVGLAINRDGFPQAHEVFAGDTLDHKTVAPMLDAMNKRAEIAAGSMVVVDRGMAFPQNIEEIRARGLHYLVATRQAEREPWVEAFETTDGFEEVIREPSPTNPAQKKSRVFVKRCRQTTEDDQGNRREETYVLCRSDGRLEKDRAIRERQEKRFLADAEKLRAGVEKGRVKDEATINQRLGRLAERYSRVARYYETAYDPKEARVEITRREEKLRQAEMLDGAYLLRTDRTDLTAEELWRIYMLLTRAENAFRCMKSPLGERPIFHHLERRVETHIFLCVLAYHLLISVEKTLLDQGTHTSWATVQDQLRTHQICTVVLPTNQGTTLKIRRATKAEPEQVELYRLLDVDPKIIPPRKTWVTHDE